MFKKSIRLRTSILFILFILLAELAAGILGISRAIGSIHSDFSRSVARIFTDDLKTRLSAAASKVTITETETENGVVLDESDAESIDAINELVSEHMDKLYPSVFYLMNADGETLLSSNSTKITDSGSVLNRAYDGETVVSAGYSADALEYALPLRVGDAVKYVVYIRDNLRIQQRTVGTLTVSLLWLMLISAAIACPLSFLLARSVARPMRTLAADAKRLADGTKQTIAGTDRKDELGELTNAIIYLSDAKKAQADKSDAEKVKVEKILQSMTDGVLAFDLRGKLTHINPEAKRLINRNFVDDITFNKFFKEINADISLESLQFAAQDDYAEREVRLNDLILQLSFTLFSRESNEGGIIVIIRDVTKHEQLESSRRDFVADVSHELRTPLTVIKSYADILADTPDAEPQVRTRFLNTISSETDRMTKIISDLLTLSKLDVNANYNRPSEEIDIRSMLEGLIERLSISAKKKEQTLTYTPINDVPMIKGDRDGLERVFTNIITNALKYTPSGGNINVFSSSMYNDIVIKVSDNGIGIPKDQLPKIFERFYRVDKARSRDKGGTGLGLAIAKQTIESAFKGKILISSELNKGTDVTITIPQQKR